MSSDAVPEADAHEQAEPVSPWEEEEQPERPRPRISDETPEADAYEQSLPAALDDEDDEGRR